MSESVWDYPRPPAVEATQRLIEVDFDGLTISTTESVRVLETSHPPVYYLPVSAFPSGSLRRIERQTFCEFKGVASYYDLHGPSRVAPASVWGYDNPTLGYEELVDKLAIYPEAMDQCRVDGLAIQPQEGDFYGGWITPDIVGPFKGAPGTSGW